MDTQHETSPLPTVPGGDAPPGHADDTQPALDGARRTKPRSKGVADRPRRPWHRAIVAAATTVAAGFLIGATVALSGAGDETTELQPRPEASIATTSPTTAVTPSSRPTTTSSTVAVAAPPSAPALAPTVATVPTVPTTVEPTSTTATTTSTSG